MRPESGLTLPEVLISVAILAIGSVYVLRAFSTISYAQMLTENQAASYLFASSKLAETEAMIAAGSEHKNQSGSFRGEGERVFRWLLNFSTYDEDLKLDLVSLDIDWQQGSRDYDFTTHTLALQKKPDDENSA